MIDDLEKKISEKTATLCIVGMGYVGLPTAVFFAEKGFRVIGCDIKDEFVKKINNGNSPLSDLNLDERVAKVVKDGRLTATGDVEKAVSLSDIILIIVPTPTKEGFEPDLCYVISAGEAVSRGLRRGQLVILESTVYPGVTEEALLPILEASGLKAGSDFGLAYCPERYNPGDPEHAIDKVTRIIGGISEEWAKVACALYSEVTEAVPVRDIKTAEMAKIIENTQRDLNIALMNEVAIICEHLGLDVIEVIKAAATKWNFHVYWPGAGVGGHCLPKDPWYLVKAAEKRGYHARVITAGREINDYMPEHIFGLLVKGLNSVGKPVRDAKVLILGLSYKENVGDLRNTPSKPLIKKIKEMGGTVYSVDPFVTPKEAMALGVDAHYMTCDDVKDAVDAIVLMTKHEQFKRDLKCACKGIVFVDGRRVIDENAIATKGAIYVGLGKGMKDQRAPHNN
ncbi:MAG: nucleotide sugar dehydrogenase [Candidatus Methanosuratincola petrocarbonis]